MVILGKVSRVCYCKEMVLVRENEDVGDAKWAPV